MKWLQAYLPQYAAMLFFHGNSMEPSPFFQALDNCGFQISNKELSHKFGYIDIIAIIRQVFFKLWTVKMTFSTSASFIAGKSGRLRARA